MAHGVSAWTIENLILGVGDMEKISYHDFFRKNHD